MDEDGKIYRGVFGTLPGQVALRRLMEEAGFFAEIQKPEAMAARNFIVTILHKMEVFKYEEQRQELVRLLMQMASERNIEETKIETASRRKR